MAKLSRIAPELPVSNLKESIEYYEQKVRFHVAMRMPSGITRSSNATTLRFTFSRTMPRILHTSESTSSPKISTRCTSNLSSVALASRRESCASPGEIATSA